MSAHEVDDDLDDISVVYERNGAQTDDSEKEDETLLAHVNKELHNVQSQIRQLEAKRQDLLQRKKDIIESREKKISDKLHGRNWEAEEFPWSRELRKALHEVFKIQNFRQLQLSAMNALLSGFDVFLIMPTGGGKSLCYQLPAVIPSSKGLTLIVAPLVSLMEDQVMTLKDIGVNAEMLNADTPREEVTRILNSMVNPKSGLRLLYVTPEKLAKSKRFMTKLQNCYKQGLFSFLAIDEVHCCSQWGHDFRPDYKFIGVMKGMFPNTPIIGLTATSTSQVTEDCKKMLNLKKCIVFKAPFNRPNLFYEVKLKPDSHSDCVKEISTLLSSSFQGQSGIIYTLSIKDVENLTKDLRQCGHRVGPYHASLEAATRSKVHKRWISGEYQAVVATIAFGMGIDKPDVRFVIHHSISKSMENFYQESGRAGRDDMPARCIAFFRFGDIFRLSTMVFTEQTGLEKLYAMAAYCINVNRCRREIIADHFGETWNSMECQEMCDVCKKQVMATKIDISEHVHVILQAISQAALADDRLTALKLQKALLGQGDSKYKVQGWKPKNLNKSSAEFILTHLLLEGVLKEDFSFTPYTTISYLVAGNIHKTIKEVIIPELNSKRKVMNDDDTSKAKRNKAQND